MLSLAFSRSTRYLADPDGPMPAFGDRLNTPYRPRARSHTPGVSRRRLDHSPNQKHSHRQHHHHDHKQHRKQPRETQSEAKKLKSSSSNDIAASGSDVISDPTIMRVKNDDIDNDMLFHQEKDRDRANSLSLMDGLRNFLHVKRHSGETSPKK